VENRGVIPCRAEALSFQLNRTLQLGYRRPGIHRPERQPSGSAYGCHRIFWRTQPF
jgi:hypothetical protein